MIPNFLKFIFNWRIIALQCCVGFCHTTMSISYKYTHVPSLLNFSPTPYSIHLSRSSQSTGLISLCYTAASHQLAILHVIYIHMFQRYSQCFPFLSAPPWSAMSECAVPSRQEEGCLASGLLCLEGSKPVRKMSQGGDWWGPWILTFFST